VIYQQLVDDEEKQDSHLHRMISMITFVLIPETSCLVIYYFNASYGSFCFEFKVWVLRYSLSFNVRYSGTDEHRSLVMGHLGDGSCFIVQNVVVHFDIISTLIMLICLLMMKNQRQSFNL
jgi:hypothetical protein